MEPSSLPKTMNSRVEAQSGSLQLFNISLTILGQPTSRLLNGPVLQLPWEARSSCISWCVASIPEQATYDGRVPTKIPDLRKKADVATCGGGSSHFGFFRISDSDMKTTLSWTADN